jgi:non-specific serine/threonine protein kinase
MKPVKRVAAPSSKDDPGSFIGKLRKRRIIETLAAFIAGGWLVLEFVDRILVAHYELNKKWLDVSFITLIGALLCFILWRWFSGTEKRPGNVKIEVLLVPLIVLVALAIDLNLILQIIGIPSKKLLIGIVAFLLGIAWIVFKSLQWAASTPDAAVKKIDISKSAEIKPEKSIVVLPFADLSPQKDQEYFCDGMTEEIITHLSRVHAIRVISRNSAMTFKGTQKTTGTIGKELNVRYVLEGSVRKSGNDLRITAQLIDSQNDAHIWVEKYAGNLDDIFDLQERLARRIVDALRVSLTSEDTRRLAKRTIQNIRSYEAWLRARQEGLKFSKEGIERGLRIAKEALSIVGEDAQLYAALSFLNYAAYDFGVSRSENTLQEAEKNAKKALELNPGLSLALFSMGLVLYKRGDIQGFVQHAKHAAEIDRNSDALAYLGFILAEVGRTVEARQYADEAVAKDPLIFLTSWMRAAVDLYDGLLDVAYDRLREAVVRFAPDDSFSLWWLGTVAAYAGKEVEALSLLKKVGTMDAGGISDFAKLLYFALQDDQLGFNTLLEKTTILDVGKTDEYVPVYLASCFARIGAKDRALEWIEQAISWGFSNHRFLSQYNRFLEPLRGDLRFKELMERARKKEQAFKV